MIKFSWVKSFAVCHQICKEKFCGFIRHHLRRFTVFRAVFQLDKTAMHFPTKVLCSSHESVVLETAYSRLGNGRQCITTHVRADFTVSRITSHWRRATVELETKMKWIASHFLVSFFCKLASQYPGRNRLYSQVLYIRHCCGIFQKFPRCQLTAEQKFSKEKLSWFTKNPQKPQKFSHHKTFGVYGICINKI